MQEGHSPGHPGIKEDSISKITNTKWGSGVVQVAKHLPGKHEALSSTTVLPKKNHR
jgi:hypothetical protein